MKLLRYTLLILAFGFVSFGKAEAQNLRDSFGHPYIIEVINLQDGVEESRPDEGYRTVAFEVVIENTSRETEDYNFRCFKVKTPRGYVIGAGPEHELGPALNYGSLTPGDKVRGWLSVEVPEDAELEDLRLTCEQVVDTDVWKSLVSSDSGSSNSSSGKEDSLNPETRAFLNDLKSDINAKEIIGLEEMVYDNDNDTRVFVLYREHDSDVGAAVYNNTEGRIRSMPLRFKNLDNLADLRFERANRGGIVVYFDFDPNDDGLEAEYVWNLEQVEVHYKEITSDGEVRYSGEATNDDNFAEMADVPISLLEQR
jgi:hypothetical protein